jgi:hypothetical protein
MKILLIGDSHVRALGSSYNLLPVEQRRSLQQKIGYESIKFGQLFSVPLLVKPFFRVIDPGLELTDTDARAKLSELSGRDVFAANDRENVYCFSMAFTTTLILRDIVWRNYCPSSVWARGKGTAISEAVLQSIIRAHFKWVLDFHRALSAAGICVISIESPPPRSDDLSIARGARADVVLEVDRIARLTIAACLAEIGMPVVRAPSECYQGAECSGFLKAEYAEMSNGDLHHANSRFGTLMLPLVLAKAAAIAKARG